MGHMNRPGLMRTFFLGEGWRDTNAPAPGDRTPDLFALPLQGRLQFDAAVTASFQVGLGGTNR
jgi:hypothetical protein